MKFTLEIELGNEAMKTGEDVKRSLLKAASLVGYYPHLDAGTEWGVYDANGNNVGKWQVTA